MNKKGDSMGQVEKRLRDILDVHVCRWHSGEDECVAEIMKVLGITQDTPNHE